MTVSSTISRKEYAGDNSTKPFATKPGGIGFYFNAEEDIKVYLRNDATLVSVLQVLTTDYTVTGEGDQVNGGTVTMVVAPLVGETLVIFHDPENKQEVDLIVAGKFAAESLETGLDHAVHLAQRNRDLIDRSLRLSDGDVTSLDMELPVVSGGKYFKINSAGTALELVEATPTSAAGLLDPEAGSFLIFTTHLQVPFDSAALSIAEKYRNVHFEGTASISSIPAGSVQIDLVLYGPAALTQYNYVVERLDPTTGITVTQGVAASSIPLIFPAGLEPDVWNWSGVVVNAAGYLTNRRGFEITFRAHDAAYDSHSGTSREIVWRVTAQCDSASIPDGFHITPDNGLVGATFSGDMRAWYEGVDV